MFPSSRLSINEVLLKKATETPLLGIIELEENIAYMIDLLLHNQDHCIQRCRRTDSVKNYEVRQTKVPVHIYVVFTLFATQLS